MTNYFYDVREVIKVIDGDTVRLLVDLGHLVFIQETYRLMDIDAPEVRGKERKKGLESKAWLKKRLEHAKTIKIQTFKDRKGKYGRYLAYLWVNDVNINDEMVMLGFAEKAEY